MAEFIWIPWNLQKIANHALSAGEVEHAWQHGRLDLGQRPHPNGPYQMSLGKCPSGRRITIAWRYDVDWDGEQKVFVITAY